MNEKQPLVTVGIPSYNYARFITTTLDSVAGQTYAPIEIIIVDDCSTDNSVSIIDEWIANYTGNFIIRFIRNEKNLGLTGVCNVILKNAKGKYFQTLDADDILLPQKIRRQVEVLETSYKAALVYSNIGIMDEEGVITNPDYLRHIGYDKNQMPAGKIFEQLFRFNFIPLPSVLVRTEYARQVGGFNESLQVQDYYMWLKLSEQYDIIYMPENTALYRAHQSSMSNSLITNPRSEDSVLNIKYHYFNSGNKNIRDIVRLNIHQTAAYLYKLKYPSAAHWLEKDLVLNPGLKTMALYTANKLGIPYNFFDKLKALLPFKGR